jgi:hypothetical protein
LGGSIEADPRDSLLPGDVIEKPNWQSDLPWATLEARTRVPAQPPPADQLQPRVENHHDSLSPFRIPHVFAIAFPAPAARGCFSEHARETFP